MQAIVWQYEQDQHYLAPRARTAHKGSFGHVVVVGGNRAYAGAATLAGTSALRSGAGLVTLATHPYHASTVNLLRPELMSKALGSVDDLQAIAEKATVLAIGVGLSQDDWGIMCWQGVQSLQKPMVVDADALNFLSIAPMKRADWVLTPHPGEASRLLNLPITEVEADRPAAVLALQQLYGGVCVLKGHETLIASDQALYVCRFGNPGMASAGMGDTLTGIIAAFIAQGMPLDVAARLGVGVHALAGDRAAIKGERGMLALDLVDCLREVINHG